MTALDLQGTPQLPAIDLPQTCTRQRGADQPNDPLAADFFHVDCAVGAGARRRGQVRSPSPERAASAGRVRALGPGLTSESADAARAVLRNDLSAA
jgi:hypothetical protein